MSIEQRSTARRPRRRRVPKAEAQVLLIDATISLMHRLPFTQVTNSKICAEADLNPSTILQHFGSLDGLLAETAKHLVNRHVERTLLEPGPSDAHSDPDVDLRNQLVAWLVLNGHDPSTFRSSILVDRNLMEFQKEFLQVDDRLAATWTTITTLIVEAQSVFGSIHALSPVEKNDALQLILALRNELPSIEQKLGWA